MSVNGNVKLREIPLYQMYEDIKQKRWRRFPKQLSQKQTEYRGGVLIEYLDSRVHAHRLLLEASSEYFFSILNTTTEDTDYNKVKFKDMEASTIENILDFIYVKKVENIQTEHEFKNILLAAHLLEYDDLFHCCFEALLVTVSAEGNSGATEQCKFYGQTRRLKIAALNFWNANAQELVCGKWLLFLSHGQVKRVLTALKGHILDADCLLGLLRWLRHDPKTRTKYSRPLLECVDNKLAREIWVVSLLKYKTQTVLCDEPVELKGTCSVITRADDYVIMQNRNFEADLFGMTNRLLFFGPCLKEKTAKDTNAKKPSVMESPLCLQQLSLATNEWHPCEKLNFACYGDAICQHGQSLYMVSRNHFAIYDVEKKQFELSECSKFKDRQCAAMCVFKGRMYIVGGSVNDHQTTSVFYAKLGSTDWQEASSLKCSVSDAIMLTSTNHIYVIVYDNYTYKISIQFNIGPDKGHPWEITFVDSNQRLWHTNFFIRDNTLQALYIEHNDTVMLMYDHGKKKMDSRHYHGHPKGLTQVMRVCPCVDEHILQVYLSTRNDSFRIPNFLWNAFNGKWSKLPPKKGFCEMPYSVFSMIYVG